MSTTSTKKSVQQQAFVLRLLIHPKLYCGEQKAAHEISQHVLNFHHLRSTFPRWIQWVLLNGNHIRWWQAHQKSPLSLKVVNWSDSNLLAAILSIQWFTAGGLQERELQSIWEQAISNFTKINGIKHFPDFNTKRSTADYFKERAYWYSKAAERFERVSWSSLSIFQLDNFWPKERDETTRNQFKWGMKKEWIFIHLVSVKSCFHISGFWFGRWRSGMLREETWRSAQAEQFRGQVIICCKSWKKWIKQLLLTSYASHQFLQSWID